MHLTTWAVKAQLHRLQKFTQRGTQHTSDMVKAMKNKTSQCLNATPLTRMTLHQQQIINMQKNNPCNKNHTLQKKLPADPQLYALCKATQACNNISKSPSALL